MLKKIKWVLLGFAVIMMIAVTYVVSLVRYAETEVTALNHYAESLLALPEVVSVQSIHRFNGLESYIVAKVEHERGQDVYFFVREGVVEDYFISSRLISEQNANAIAQSLVWNGEIIQTQLGILEGTPIFEVKIKSEDVVHYIVIDAQTREVLMNFYL